MRTTSISLILFKFGTQIYLQLQSNIKKNENLIKNTYAEMEKYAWARLRDIQQRMQIYNRIGALRVRTRIPGS